MNEPIIEFKTVEEARESLKEWQHKLFLDDWIIKIKILKSSEMPQSDEAGHNELLYTSKASIISLSIHDDDTKDEVQRRCDEKTLVHELLHCKYCSLQSNDSYEQAFLDVHQHVLLEQMSKSLIMAKYNIGLEWFVNF